MVSNPFRSAKWRHVSTTTELKPISSPQTTVIAPPSPPDSTTTTKKKKNIPFNSDTLLDGIGDYIFQSPLGGGKFSKVMLCYHYLTGLKVAIKMINKKEHPYRVMSRLVREISIMEVLEHQNIVKLYETYETADTLYIVMEYVPGYNLEEYLKSIDQSAIPEHHARDIFRQVVKAVDHCHSKWIVHRDLKTPNILLTPDHQVKIADFGLGNRFGLQRLRTICGSLLYYSPEIMTSRSYIGPEVDSWCLGIMLYRMTAGLELFAHAKTQPELRKLVISHRYKFPSRLTPELQETIKKCLAVDRFDRLSLKSFLSNDAWFNDFGKLQDIFEERVPDTLYHANQITEAYAQSIREEDNTRIQACSQNSKRLHLQDLQDEKTRAFKVPKTVIYHITNASTYFTGTAPHHSRLPIDLDAQKVAKAELHQNILMTLKQVRLQQVNHVADLGSPISHLFRKFKRTEVMNQERQLRKASSALNLTQLYQRVTKDHISYYTIQCHIHTGSSTTFVSDYSNSTVGSSTTNTMDQKRSLQRNKLTNRLSMVFFSNTQPEFNLSNNKEDMDPERNKRNQAEMIRIVRMVCDILGISYYQSSVTQLVCLLTLKNSKKHTVIPTTNQQQRHSLFRSRLFTSNDRLSDLNRSHQQQRQQQSNSFISNSSNHSGTNHPSGWFSRQVHRLSQQLSFSNMDNTTQLFGVSSHGHDLLNIGRTEQEQQIQQRDEDTDVEEEEDGSSDGFVTLSIDVSSISSNKYNDDGTPVQIVSLRYSKLKGSSKVFKLAKGWIQALLFQNNNDTQPRMMNRSELDAYMKSVDLDAHENDIIRL
ncbi:kinase-like domain-containing protein [Helicostylum pulchrum]|uniref:Protein kinase domain-containing protein n=1 Tax=Helicostylum pulchrum TaxID=562976 RepID=A0ABP9YG74_9FUNG|nr:kinase-like domain-containing protein [Helicostylum pulchrum]